MSQPYTVFGYRMDSGESFVHHVMADDPQTASDVVKYDFLGTEDPPAWEIVGVIAGHHMDLQHQDEPKIGVGVSAISDHPTRQEMLNLTLSKRDNGHLDTAALVRQLVQQLGFAAVRDMLLAIETEVGIYTPMELKTDDLVNRTLEGGEINPEDYGVDVSTPDNETAFETAVADAASAAVAQARYKLSIPDSAAAEFEDQAMEIMR